MNSGNDDDRNGDDTSRDAAESIRPFSAAMKERVRRHIAVCDGHGATCDEIEVRLGLRHQTASARIKDLAKDKVIYRSGTTRPTRSGRQAHVWLAQTNAPVLATPKQGSLL